MSSASVAKEAIEIMNSRITNEIFLIIQNNKDLMAEYLDAVNAEDGRQNVNQVIGREIKKAYNLENNGRENNPSSILIESYQKFKRITTP
jgi:hypothetical protein